MREEHRSKAASVFDIHGRDDEDEPDSLGWVYVTIHSENVEAVAMHIGRHGGRLVIRRAESGRP